MSRFASRAILAAFVLSAILAGCEGPVGPQGPIGPPGPQGPQGPPAQARFEQGTIPSNGEVAVVFSNVNVNNAVVDCWISNRSDVWVKITTRSSRLACGVIQEGSDLAVVLIARGLRGWRYLIVVMTGG